MRAALAFFLLVLLAAAGAGWWLKMERYAPTASLAARVDSVGRNLVLDIAVHSDAPGLRTASVRLQAGGTTFALLDERYPAVNWRGSLLTDKRLHVDSDLAQLKVPEGAATLEVLADSYAWHVWPPRPTPCLSVPVTVDLTPPRVDLLTTQHNVRLGGVELAVFRQSPDTVRSGIAVDRYFFPAVTGYFADPAVALAFFAVPQDLTVEARPQLVARDAAGNQRTVPLPCVIAPRHFAERTLQLDDAFLSRKVPELERANHLPPAADLLQGYLRINRDLRVQNEARLQELAATSVGQPLWTGAFHRQSNAAALSSFADRRSYTYRGEVVDHQTHLGFDLASLKMSPVEAAQNGIVVFADNLGIYGNAVVVDHGLGIFSLYGHLSSIAVTPGERVTMGQSLGQTGETGLAGGDHLHFSIMLRGVHVDPVEWWDPHWLHDHVTPKLAMFARAATSPKAERNEQAKP